MTDIKSRPWPAIAETYRDFIHHNWEMQPMLNLVNAIGASHYAEGVFAATSLSTLCVSQNAVFDMERNLLRVDFKNGRFVFSYIESIFKGPAWQKECEPGEGFSTFEHVVGRLKWFMS